MREVILVPLKRFDTGKSRLRQAFSDTEVSDLTRRLARGVLHAAAPRECWVLCDDDDVASFARDEGATVVRVPALDLNAAVDHGYQRAGKTCARTIVVHADLAHPDGIGVAPFDDGVTIVTDRHGTGTNVLVVPTGLEFHFAFGPHSAAAHAAEARRLGWTPTVVTDSPWGLDIDEPEDRAALEMG